VILLSFLIFSHCEVSYSSLKGFWEATYDPDANGKASVEDFLKYFQLMEPEDNLTKA
jgi:hypothetical protein